MKPIFTACYLIPLLLQDSGLGSLTRDAPIATDVLEIDLVESSTGQDLRPIEDYITSKRRTLHRSSFYALDIKTVNGSKKINLQNKAPLFNPDFQVEECKGGKCVEENISKKLEKDLIDSTFEGRLDDDPEAVVSVSNISGSLNLAIVSGKKTFDAATYRAHDGVVSNHESDGMMEAEDLFAGLDGVGQIQKSAVKKVVQGSAFIDAKGNTVEFEKADPHEPAARRRNSGLQYAVSIRCCRLTKKFCVRTSEKEKAKCTKTIGKTVCGEDKCNHLKASVQFNAKQNIKNVAKKKMQHKKDEDMKEEKVIKEIIDDQDKDIKAIKKEDPEINEETPVKPEASVEITEKPEIYTKPTEGTTEKPKMSEETSEEPEVLIYNVPENKEKPEIVTETIQEPESSEVITEKPRISEETTEEQLDSEEMTTESIFSDSEEEVEEEESKEKVPENLKSKYVNDLLLDEITKIHDDTMAHTLSDQQPSNQFRSRMVICMGACEGGKADNPKTAIYKEKTIELGIFTDKYLWQQMQKIVGGSDSEMKEAMLKMIHSLIVGTESFFRHQSISKTGGFRFTINGVGIWKDDSEAAIKSVHESSTMQELLSNFYEYAKGKNEIYDGNSKSFDMMILLSGADSEVSNLNVDPGFEQGMAYVSLVCSRGPVGVIKIVLEEGGTHRDNTPALLAHEMGHLMGSGHDGTIGTYRKNVEQYGKMIDCPQEQNLMTPVLKPGIKDWSTCSRDQIDYNYDRREQANPNSGNCFYT